MNCLRAFVLCIAAALGACGGGGEKIEAIYQISAPTAPAIAGATSAQVLLPEPRALAALASNKLPVKPTPITLSYYPSVSLEDTAPKVMQRVMLDTFTNSGRVRAVGLPGQSLLINYQIVTEMRAFQAETYEGNRVRIVMAAKLLNDANGRVLRDEVFTATVPVSSDSAEDAAIGLNAAAEAISRDILDWTLAII